MKPSQLAFGAIGFLGVAMIVAWKQPQDAELTKRVEQIEKRLTEFQQRLEKLERPVAEIEARKRLAITRAQLRSVQTALSIYELETGQLPTTEQGLKSLFEKPTAAPVPKRWVKCVEDEKSLNDAWGQILVYRLTGKDDYAYELYSIGPDDKPGTDDDIHEKP